MMKRVIPLFAVAVCFSAVAARAATAVDSAVAGNPIDNSVVWSGRVIVEKEVRIGRGGVLTVRPGTVVLFGKGAGLVVEGELVAEGAPGSPIRFEPADATAAPGDWSGIVFSGSRDGSVLFRCVVRSAAAIVVEGCRPSIRSCEMENGRTGVVAARHAAPVISGNTVRGMTDGGIRCDMESAPRIEKNSVASCGPFGILAGQGAAPEIRNNVISDCDRGLVFSGTIPPVEGNELRKNKVGVIASGASPGQAIRGNRFVENQIGMRCEQFSSPLVERNEFRANGEGISCYRSSSPLIRNNAIAGNERGIACSNLSAPRIEANEIAGNGKGIFLTLSSYAVIRGNNLTGNDIQVELGNMSYDWEARVAKKPERGAQARLAVRMGRGLAGPAEIAETQARGDGAAVMGAVDATGNWWGDEDTREMEKKGADANISRLVDYYDVPRRTYEGYEGEYVQDRIRYEGWKTSRIAGAGIR